MKISSAAAKVYACAMLLIVLVIVFPPVCAHEQQGVEQSQGQQAQEDEATLRIACNELHRCAASCANKRMQATLRTACNELHTTAASCANRNMQATLRIACNERHECAASCTNERMQGHTAFAADSRPAVRILSKLSSVATTARSTPMSPSMARRGTATTKPKASSDQITTAPVPAAGESAKG